MGRLPLEVDDPVEVFLAPLEVVFALRLGAIKRKILLGSPSQQNKKKKGRKKAEQVLNQIGRVFTSDFLDVMFFSQQPRSVLDDHQRRSSLTVMPR